MRWSLSCVKEGATAVLPSPSDPNDACGGLGSVTARETREAPPLWPSWSSGRGNAWLPAQSPAGLVAAVHVLWWSAAGCSMPGGALANATPAAESCPFPPKGDRDLGLCAAWGGACVSADESSPGVPELLYHLTSGSSSSCIKGRWRDASWSRGEKSCGVSAAGVSDTLSGPGGCGAGSPSGPPSPHTSHSCSICSIRNAAC